MKTLRFRNANGEYQVVKNASEVEVIDEPEFKLFIRFNNDTSAIFTDTKDGTLARIAQNLDNPYVISILIKNDLY